MDSHMKKRAVMKLLPALMLVALSLTSGVAEASRADTCPERAGV
jgi:hypothetical protein